MNRQLIAHVCCCCMGCAVCVVFGDFTMFMFCLSRTSTSIHTQQLISKKREIAFTFFEKGVRFKVAPGKNINNHALFFYYANTQETQFIGSALFERNIGNRRCRNSCIIVVVSKVFTYSILMSLVCNSLNEPWSKLLRLFWNKYFFGFIK